MLKTPKINSKKVRASAKGQACTLELPGVCNYNPETTVLAHLPDESNGMGTKPDDISACYACCACHDAIDGRVGFSLPDCDFYFRRAQTRTLRALFSLGILTIK